MDYTDKSLVTMSHGNGYWVRATSSCLWTVTDEAAPLLSLQKTGPATAVPGEVITYTITVSNLGSAAAYDIAMTDTYPAGVTYISSVPAPTVGNNLWMFASLGQGASVTINITVMVNPGASGILINQAEADYEDGLGIPQPPAADTAQTIVINPVMTISKAAPATAHPGDIIVYTLTYSNTGTDWAYNVWVNDTLPPEATYISAMPAPGAFAGQMLSWYIAAIGPGASGSITITVMLDAALTEGAVVTNNASIEWENSAGLAYVDWCIASTIIVQA
jgi:uncharacterized repeat protein (TIGR01451 family)